MLALLSVPAAAHAAPAVDERGGVIVVCTEGPDAALARAERLRGDAAVHAAAVLPNPELVAEHTSDLAGRGEHETVIGLSVPLGIGGRRFVLQEAAEARRDQAQAQGEAHQLDAALAFRRAYARLVLDQARLAVLEGQQEDLVELTEKLEALAKGGESAGYDLLRQQNHMRLQRRKLLRVRARVASTRAGLEAWLGRPVKISDKAVGQLAGGPDLLRRAASAQGSLDPSIRALRASARASRLEVDAAERRWVPDLDVFAGYRHVTSSDAPAGHGIALGLSLPLTFFDHGQGEARRATAEQRWAEAAAARVERTQVAEQAAALARLRLLQAGMGDLEEAGREALQLRAMALRLYAADEASLLELHEAHHAAEEARVAFIDQLEAIVDARLDLMRSRGSQLDAALDRHCGRADARRTR